MGGFSGDVERWREIAAAESRGIPVDLVLAFMGLESKGKPGAIGYTDTGSNYTDAELRGLPVALRRRALGLLQVAPVVLRDYNARAGEPSVIPPELVARGLGDSRKQIRVGTWLLRQCLFFSHDLDPKNHPWPYGPLTDPQIAFARLAVHKGMQGTRKQLAAAAAAGFPATVAGLEAFDPIWGAPDKPYRGARAAVAAYRSATDGDEWRAPPGPVPTPTPPGSGSGAGVALGALALGALAWFLAKSRPARAT